MMGILESRPTNLAIMCRKDSQTRKWRARPEVMKMSGGQMMGILESRPTNLAIMCRKDSQTRKWRARPEVMKMSGGQMMGILERKIHRLGSGGPDQRFMKMSGGQMMGILESRPTNLAIMCRKDSQTRKWRARPDVMKHVWWTDDRHS
ncbi:hypothetical protein J6590_049086 [Homalodisca vitripennis]|nr:hypothetical protein J6590_049086 [Homalodisca vitripennis]